MRWKCLGLAITVGCSSYGSGGGAAGTGTSVAAGGTSAGANNVAGSVAVSGAGGSATGGAGGSATGGSSGSSADSGGAPSSSAGMTGTAGNGPLATGKQVLIWIWMNYKDDLAAVTAHPQSFTHVSPALYTMNYAYQSGPLQKLNTNDNYDGLSSMQIAQQIHAAGLKCVPLVYAGAGNGGGTDVGIQNVIADNPPGTQNNLITAMIAEAKAEGYDGWNLDWEVANTGYAQYGAKLISFLGAFKKALNQQGMQLSIDLGGWYVHQCGGDGLVDLIQLGANVDLAIMEDYAKTLGTPDPSCPATPPGAVNCYKDFTGELDVMCNMPPANVSIGVIAPDTSAFASQAFTAVARYGFTGVALWPGNMGFLAKDNFPDGQSWLSVFSDFLASK